METTSAAMHPPAILPSRQAAASSSVLQRIPSSASAPGLQAASICAPSRAHLPCRTRCRTITLRRSAKNGHPSNHWSANGCRLQLTTDRVAAAAGAAAVVGYRTVHPIGIDGGCLEGGEDAAAARKCNGVFRTQGVVIVDADDDEKGHVLGRCVTTPGCHHDEQRVANPSISGGAGTSSGAADVAGSRSIRGRKTAAKVDGGMEKEESGELLKGTDDSIHRIKVSICGRSMDSIDDDRLRSEFFSGLERSAKLQTRRKMRSRRQREKTGSEMTEEGNLTKLDLEDKENHGIHNNDDPYSREFLRTSTAISLLPLKVGYLPDATDVIVSNVSSVTSSLHQQTSSSNDVTEGDIPEVTLTSHQEARRSRFSKYTSSATSSTKRTTTESGIKGCAAKRKIRRSQAQLDLQNCDGKSTVVHAKFRHSVDSYIQISIAKSKSVYGFAVVGEHPVTVSRVHCKGPAHEAGLHEGDVIWRINRQNVCNFTSASVARIIRLSFDGRVVLEVLRPKQTFQNGMLGRLRYAGNQYLDESSFDSDSTLDATSLNQILPCRTQ